MGTMLTTRVGLPPPPWTVEDLADFPDDGLRYELLDGALLVSSSPTLPHQDAALTLYALLRSVRPPHLKVLGAPLDVRLSATRLVQPDVLVVRRADAQGRTLTGIPVLAVEVLSPGTRLRDQSLKRAAFQEAGVTSYWLLDPDEPTLTALELRGGVYVEVAHVRDDEPFEATLPFPVRVVPSELQD